MDLKEGRQAAVKAAAVCTRISGLNSCIFVVVSVSKTSSLTSERTL